MEKTQKLLMGNEAIAFGAMRAGVSVVCGYPGTPSTEILETIAKNNDGSIYVEWSVNEKVALEVAIGASYSGARSLVTMKQVGLNVASDPLMSLRYIGVKGGLVIACADDPGPISSQTEQDTRTFALFSKLPVFDPTSPEEAYEMIADAFEYSEKYKTPVIFRPTTRVCHSNQSILLKENLAKKVPEGFIKDSSKWVIFPRLSYNNHIKIEKELVELSDDFSNYKFNNILGDLNAKKGIAVSGVSYAYLMENKPENVKIFKIATVNPFPEKLALEFLKGLDEVLCLEELDPAIERQLLMLVGKNHLSVKIKGKLTFDTKNAGENTTESVLNDVNKFLNIEQKMTKVLPQPPILPVRPPVLCAGCPHRASFYAVKEACKGKKAVFSGDIGCYTLGNAMPLDMVDTCLCMGADVTIAQGIHRVEPDTLNFAFIGDSTFFASGITGIINAVYNKTDIILVVLDNSTTAMTGHQPHPATGKTMMNEVTASVSIEKILQAVGVEVSVCNPLNLEKAIETVKTVSNKKGVQAIIFKSPCIAVSKPTTPFKINQDLCKNCKICINKLGCPAISVNLGKVEIEKSLCFGCGLCAKVCPFNAIKEEE